jgi:hypothetical protein
VYQIQSGLKYFKNFGDCNHPYTGDYESNAAPNGKVNHASRGSVGAAKVENTLPVVEIMEKKEQEQRVVQFHFLTKISYRNIVKQ